MPPILSRARRIGLLSAFALILAVPAIGGTITSGLQIEAGETFQLGGGQEGEYRVEIELACADGAAGSRVQFDACGQSLDFIVPATGGWQSYRTVGLGRVKVPVGSHSVVLRALSKPGEAVVNVRQVRMVRAATARDQRS